MPTLGCGSYVASIAERGGAAAYSDLPVSSIDWGRKGVDVTEGKVDLAGDTKCAVALRSVEPWVHELHLFRDDELVWLGPIVTKAGLTLRARDLGTWLDRRTFPVSLDYSNELLSTILAGVVAAAMLLDPSPNLTVRVASEPGTRADRAYSAGKHPMTGDAARELGRSGAEWTTLLREIVVSRRLEDETDAGAIPELRDEHLLGVPDVEVDGLLMANAWGVRGGSDQVTDSADDPVYGEAQKDSSIVRYGLIQRVATEDTIRDDGSAGAAALERLRATARPIVNLGGLTLAASAPVDVKDLAPGRLLRLRLEETGTPVRQTVRITNVAVTGSDKTEKVDVTVEPLVSVEG